ncbi:MAG: hypothetical protein N7Q72_03825, partial [Spiroplasma sp. Tabriz.8]|nr:hypothetical protein [Spiroplasma sp. Tabriz.8]
LFVKDSSFSYSIYFTDIPSDRQPSLIYKIHRERSYIYIYIYIYIKQNWLHIKESTAINSSSKVEWVVENKTLYVIFSNSY